MFFDFFYYNLLFTSGFSVLVFILFLFIISFFYRYALLITVPLLVFSLYFFRNPDRISLSKSEYDLISPADGVVVEIQNSQNSNLDGFAKRISIFLSPFDVHVQWMPCNGTVEGVTYRPGKFLVAFEPKSSELNERNDVKLRCINNNLIEIRQIAGFVARRICCWIKNGDVVKEGQKYGMIRFGSRIDLMLPENVHIDVREGDYVFGGETVIGNFLE